MSYELMLVATVDKGDQLLSRVEKSLKDANASNINVERLGKKTLSYTIKKQTDATYFVVSFEAEGKVIKPIWDKLKLEQEDLLRYLLLKKKERKAKTRRGKESSPFVKTTGDKQVSQETEEKPKVTVAVKKASKVKSGEEKVSQVRKVSKVKKGTGSKKGKSKK